MARRYYGAAPTAPQTGGKVQGAVTKGVAIAANTTAKGVALAFVPVKFAVHTVGTTTKKLGDLIYSLSTKF